MSGVLFFIRFCKYKPFNLGQSLACQESSKCGTDAVPVAQQAKSNIYFKFMLRFL